MSLNVWKTSAFIAKIIKRGCLSVLKSDYLIPNYDTIRQIFFMVREGGAGTKKEGAMHPLRNYT